MLICGSMACLLTRSAWLPGDIDKLSVYLELRQNYLRSLGKLGEEVSDPRMLPESSDKVRPRQSSRTLSRRRKQRRRQSASPPPQGRENMVNTQDTKTNVALVVVRTPCPAGQLHFGAFLRIQHMFAVRYRHLGCGRGLLRSRGLLPIVIRC